MDPTAMLTLTSAAIGAVTGAFTMGDRILTRRREARDRRNEVDARWRLDIEGFEPDGTFRVRLRYDLADAPRLRLLTLKALKPPGIELAAPHMVIDDTGNVERYEPDAAGWHVELPCRQDLVASHNVTGRGIFPLSYAAVHVLARRTAGKTRPDASLRIELELESISGARRRHSHVLTVRDVEWP